MSAADLSSNDGQPAGAEGVVNSVPAVGPGAEQAPGQGLPASDASETPAGGPPDGGAFPGDPGMRSPEPPPKGGLHYWAGVDVPADERAAYEALGTQLEDAEVRQKIGATAVAWLGYMHKADVSKVKPFHRFDFSKFARFTPEDKPYLDYLGNTLAAAGATQKEVDALLTIYDKGQQQIAKRNMAAEMEADRLDAEDAKKAEKVLRQEWGAEYGINVRLLKQYIASLSREERQRIESQEMPDGSLALNNPAKIRELVKLARSGGKAAAGKSSAERIAEIKEIMRTDRRRYLKDERLQAEYRDLLLKHG